MKFSKLPTQPSMAWKEETLRLYQNSGVARVEATIDTYYNKEEWQEVYDEFKDRQEGQVSVEIRQNTYVIRTWSLTIPNLVIGVYHTGIQVIGMGEYSFDSKGIYRLSYDEARDIEELRYSGCTRHHRMTNYNAIEAAVEELRYDFPAGSYDVATKNCHHFCDALASKLGIPPLQKKYTRAARIYQPAEATCQKVSSICRATWAGMHSILSACVQRE